MNRAEIDRLRQFDAVQEMFADRPSMPMGWFRRGASPRICQPSLGGGSARAAGAKARMRARRSSPPPYPRRIGGDQAMKTGVAAVVSVVDGKAAVVAPIIKSVPGRGLVRLRGRFEPACMHWRHFIRLIVAAFFGFGLVRSEREQPFERGPVNRELDNSAA